MPNVLQHEKVVLFDAPALEDTSRIVEQFHRLYYGQAASQTWRNTFWRGIHVNKCPLDLWVYQEIIFDVRPDIIVETGTGRGGSTHFLASMCDVMGRGEVLSVDLYDTPYGKNVPAERPAHPRITYLRGSSTSAEVLSAIHARIQPHHRVLVILDSHHSCDHVYQELLDYSKIVTPGSYVIVEDSNVNNHPVLPNFGPGPMEAVDAFLAHESSFWVDGSREKFFMTFNPRGFLKRIA